ncbi:uncharacterized protein PG986_000210 [Apiospora aurea]|uniref:Uncharacterized protein n=1 Tax=Apiospora aurea TaxID=335848 RepID=A0ABR1QTF9_9PEZI
MEDQEILPTGLGPEILPPPHHHLRMLVLVLVLAAILLVEGSWPWPDCPVNAEDKLILLFNKFGTSGRHGERNPPGPARPAIAIAPDRPETPTGKTNTGKGLTGTIQQPLPMTPPSTGNMSPPTGPSRAPTSPTPKPSQTMQERQQAHKKRHQRQKLQRQQQRQQKLHVPESAELTQLREAIGRLGKRLVGGRPDPQALESVWDRRARLRKVEATLMLMALEAGEQADSLEDRMVDIVYPEPEGYESDYDEGPDAPAGGEDVFTATATAAAAAAAAAPKPTGLLHGGGVAADAGGDDVEMTSVMFRGEDYPFGEDEL